MAVFVLVHGGWHGSWCWSLVAPMLEAAGHQVFTPDLPVLPEDASMETARPVARWADQIAQLARSQSEPVVLVGHSRSGLVISEAAERAPEHVALLVYLSAYLLRDGERMLDYGLRQSNAEQVQAGIAIDGGFSRIKPDHAADLFYNRTPAELAYEAGQRLVAQPAIVFMTPINVTDEKFGRVPRAFVESARDHAIPLTTQRAMQEALPCSSIETLDSDHSAFLSTPSELVAALQRCVTSVAEPRSGS